MATGNFPMPIGVGFSRSNLPADAPYTTPNFTLSDPGYYLVQFDPYDPANPGICLLQSVISGTTATVLTLLQAGQTQLVLYNSTIGVFNFNTTKGAARVSIVRMDP